jgi:glycosyltransferase involved in cell wall biosynthesis
MHCDWLTQLSSGMIEHRLKATDLIVGCSDFVTQKIREKYPEYAPRCYTVPNGVSLEKFNRTEVPLRRNDKIRLIYVGRISPEKGIHVLLDAFERIAQRYSNVVLEIVGPAGAAPMDFIVNISDEEKVRGLAAYYMENYLRYLKNRLPACIAERVTFTGFVPNDNLADHYTTADILINPSFSESFGMSLIEAMACGLPVVATRVGGMPEIVEEGRTGLLVESGNVVELSNAISTLIENESLRRDMGQAGQDRAVQMFTWENVVGKLYDSYMKVIANHG